MNDRISSILDRTFFHPTRFFVIRQLVEAGGKQSFVELFKGCNVKNHGTLRSHLKALERAGYVESVKSFNGVVPLTTVFLTETGRRAFQSHVLVLADLVRSPENGEAHV
jgi:DNA-binding HxlR family transcriptional regulator